MLKKIWAWLSFVMLSSALVACSGGGGCAGTTPLNGGSDSCAATASAMTLTLSAYSLTNLNSSSIVATVTTVDSNRNIISGIPVTLSVNEGAVVIPSDKVTDTSGSLTGTIKIGENFSNRVVTVTATTGKLTQTASFVVTGAKIAATLSSVVVKSSVNNIVTYKLSDAAGGALAFVPITVSVAGAVAGTAKTDVNGNYTISYTAPSQAGSITINAAAAGVTDTQIVVVGSGESNTIPNAVGVVKSSSLSANPSVVAVNSASDSNNQVELRALFVGDANKPIENIRVRFYLPDPNNVGGAITVADSLFYSNSNGIVLGAYKPGARSSPTDGVTVRACWDYKDFASDASLKCPTDSKGAEQKVEVKLTVASEPLSVTIGENNLLEIGDSNNLTYIKRFVVFVADSAGMPKSNVIISAFLDLTWYAKGSYYVPLGSSSWSRSSNYVFCESEDADRNGVLDLGEDVNFTNELEPRKADALVNFIPSGITGVTDSSGMAVLKIQYPRSVATWVDYLLTVRAGVLGTEGQDTTQGTLPALASDLNDITVSPPFQVSPYGTVLSCLSPF